MNDLFSVNNKRIIQSSRKFRYLSPLENNSDTKRLNRISSVRNLKQNHKFFQNKIRNSNSSNNYLDLVKNFFSRNEENSMIKDNKLISFEEYNKKLDKNLKDYKSIIIDEKQKLLKQKKKKRNDDESENEEEKEEKEKKDKKKKENVEKIKKKKLLKNYSEPYYKVVVKDINYYKNPFESLNAINNNNDIFNEISKDYIVRQRILYDNQVRNFENYSMKFKTKMPKIKVQDLSSKINGEIPVINLIKNEDYKNSSNNKEEELLPKIQKSLGGIKLFSYFKYPPKIFPEGKEQFGLCSKGKYLYLSGGLSTYMKQMSIWSLNMETLEWNKLQTLNTTNCRFGHTSVFYQNKIFLYGGRIKVEKASMLVGLEVYSLNENLFVSSMVKGGPIKRRNHIAEVIGNLMLIHGGIDEDNEILDDTYLLNMNQIKWVSPSLSPYGPSPKVFGHSSCLVIPYAVLNNNKFNIYKYPDLDYYNKNPKKKRVERGLYVFGGKTKETDGITNNLWVLILGQKPLHWVKIDTKGNPPSPRYFHSMNFYEKSNYIIIHGGRNDNLSSSSGLNDTFILDLLNFNWIQIQLYSNIQGFKIISRFGHNSSIFANKLIIFGGMNNNNYIGSSLFIVNLDFHYSTILKTAEQLMYENLQNNNEKESKKKIQKLKKELQKFEIGIVTPINLPPIK